MLNTMKAVALVVGVISVLLGGLWLLQGLGLLHVRPILCFVDCAPIQGPSLTWAIVGFILATFGLFAIFYWLKHRANAARAGCVSNNRWRGP
jgi:hypothetical protein